MFIGTRVAEIQKLTDPQRWRYVTSPQNPADDITWGKTLQELSNSGRWRNGPTFVQKALEFWPSQPVRGEPDNDPELCKSATSCLATTTAKTTSQIQIDQCSSFTELTEAVAHSLYGAAVGQNSPSAADYPEAEREILQQAQEDSFPKEYNLLSADKPVPTTSRLLTLAPKYDQVTGLISRGKAWLQRLLRARSYSPCGAGPLP